MNVKVTPGRQPGRDMMDHKIFSPYGNLHFIIYRRNRSPQKLFHSWPLGGLQNGLREVHQQETPKGQEGGTGKQARRGGQHPNGERMPPPRELRSSSLEQKLREPRQSGCQEPLESADRMRSPQDPAQHGRGRGRQGPSEPAMTAQIHIIDLWHSQCHHATSSALCHGWSGCLCALHARRRDYHGRPDSEQKMLSAA